MRSDYGERYRELYERHWWWRSREKAILDVLRAKEPLGGWNRILDVGCGDGLFFDQLAQFGEVEGVEPVEALVNAAGPHRSSIHIAPFDENFKPVEPFSLILMLDVLEHLAQPVQAVRHALSLLVPAGTLLITVPAFTQIWTNHDVINDHFTRYTKRSLRDVALHAGLSIEYERYLYQWLFPVKFATRIAERALDVQPKPAGVPAQWINGLLFWLSRLEQKTWGKLPIPFGSSLMILGRSRPPQTPERPAQ